MQGRWPSKEGGVPDILTPEEQQKIKKHSEHIHYSPRYSDSEFEYRHVQLPKAMMEHIPSRYFDRSDPDRPLLRLLLSKEWRSMGITQSKGWRHYEVHAPEPHILLFKIPLNYNDDDDDEY